VPILESVQLIVHCGDVAATKCSTEMPRIAPVLALAS
jgi:predicted phosphodiesterase